MTKTTAKLVPGLDGFGNESFNRGFDGAWVCYSQVVRLWHDIAQGPLWLEFSTDHKHPDEQVGLYFRHSTWSVCWGRTNRADATLYRLLTKWLLHNFPRLENHKPLRLYVRVLYEEKVA